MAQNPARMTPMMKQYTELKEQYEDCILFFRMGDFYEMFGDDAVEASKIMGIALTSRNKNDADETPMCGIPHHSYAPYLVKLLKAGRKVAFGEQLEDPKQAKGLVKRGVTRVVTPGTAIEDDALAGASNNFLAAVHEEKGQAFIAIIDVGTGDVFLEHVPVSGIGGIVSTWGPKEAVAAPGVEVPGVAVTPGHTASADTAVRRVCRHYDVSSERALGIEHQGFFHAIHMALRYLSDVMIDTSLSRPVFIPPDDRVVLDAVAVRTLELLTGAGGTEEGSLFSVLNGTKTAMGTRLLKQWLMVPVRRMDEIGARCDVVEAFVTNAETRETVRELLAGVYDIERIITRITADRAGARDLVWLKNSVNGLPAVRRAIAEANHPVLNDIAERLDGLDGLAALIEAAIADDAPATLTRGGIIKEGYDADVDEYRRLRTDSRAMLAVIESEERERTGISSLKVKYNKVFGYHIEVSKSNLDRVPDDYERRQTLVNAERFVTPKLKELEEKVLSAEERLSGLEHELFVAVRRTVGEYAPKVRETAKAVARLDVLAGFAHVASRNRYVRPVMESPGRIDITGGRHPVVEASMSERFIANDALLDDAESRMLIITGPNMAGKSTYLRMVALVTLMAHIGSFVPADSAHIGLVDRIFTRVGASDNLARGESTFMVEMVETANILGGATPESLIVLDEIGRGTSTFDGISIAWAVAEYIASTVKAKTLFATHYHELTDIVHTTGGVRNFTIEVREWEGEVVFLRRIIPGTADRSYGIHVGRLAGLPRLVTDRADGILEQLEKNEFGLDGVPKLARRSKKVPVEAAARQQMLVFDDNPAVDELKSIDVNAMTPIDALNMLAKLKKMVEDT